MIDEYDSFPPIWVSKDGKKYHVQGMKISHIHRCMNGLRLMREKWVEVINAGYSVANMLQGEHAIDCIDRDIQSAEDDYDEFREWSLDWSKAFNDEIKRRTHIDARVEGKTIVYFDKRDGAVLHRGPI